MKKLFALVSILFAGVVPAASAAEMSGSSEIQAQAAEPTPSGDWSFRLGALGLISSDASVVASADYRLFSSVFLGAWAAASDMRVSEKLGAELEFRPLVARLVETPRSAQLGVFVGTSAAGTAYFGPRFLLEVVPNLGVTLAAWNYFNGASSRIETAIEFRI